MKKSTTVSHEVNISGADFNRMVKEFCSRNGISIPDKASMYVRGSISVAYTSQSPSVSFTWRD